MEEIGKRLSSVKSKIHLAGKPKCSFCGEIPAEESTMITAPNNVFICEKCALTCTAMFYDMNPEKWYNDLMYIIERIDAKNLKSKRQRRKA